MRKGTCLLCGNCEDLATESHIIPKFMYKGMEDERNKIGVTILKDNIKTQKEIDYRYFDRDVLCITCETKRLSRLDSYGNRVLFGDSGVEDLLKTNVYELPDGKICEIKNVDYSKFKLFLLSILWRAHISKQIFFSNINLASKEELIRDAILKNDSSLCDSIDISILGLMFNRNKLYKVVSKPRHIFTEKLDVYSFVIFGIVYNFIYKDDDKIFCINENIFRQNQDLKIPFYLGLDAANFFKSFAMPTGASLDRMT